jgi:cytochrome b6-f complex iron-sulfur subunit
MVPLLRTLFGLALAPLLGRVVGLVGRFQHNQPKRVERRLFLRNVLLGSAGLVSLQLAGGFLVYFWPLKTSQFGGLINVPAAAVPPPGDEPVRVQEGKFWLINNDDGLLALYWKCPHLGCTVPWNQPANQFQCPCHGSIYDRHGVLISGPAPRPMDIMAMTVEGGNVIVNTGDITERSDWTPEQSTPYGG